MNIIRKGGEVLVNIAALLLIIRDSSSRTIPGKMDQLKKDNVKNEKSD